MNDEIDLIKVNRHPATQAGCRHWAPIFGVEVDDKAKPDNAPLTPAQDDDPTDPVEPDSG
ncbi:MAG: hypothetical protein H6R14_235 [Proteobacteria bacterium]|nr:hypothetical protein [Pseudomonadota bacterium]